MARIRLADLLPLTRLHLAARLTARARAARDGRHFETAAALYEEALALRPKAAHLHVQAGHMFKEAGAHDAAERHYLAALAALPGDADLALQLGHFYKLADRAAEAEAHYARALALDPALTDAADELARIGTGAPPAGAGGGGAPLPGLLPRGLAPARPREGFRVLHLGSRRVRSEWGLMKALAGVEAIRGTCVAPAPIAELELRLDDRIVARAPLAQHPLPDGRIKHVFNLWHDFGAQPPGRYLVELRLTEAAGRVRTYREHLLVTRPLAEDEAPASDALVVPGAGSAPLEARIDALPSVVRPARRSVLPDPVATILVQRADQLGDLAVSVPAIRRLKALFPGARLTALLAPGNADLGRASGLFDEVIVAGLVDDPLEQRRVMPAYAQAALAAALAGRRFDLALDLGEGAESRALLLLVDAAFRYGFKDREAPWLDAGFELNGHDPFNRLEMIAPARKLVAMVEALGALRAPPPVPHAAADRALLADHGLAAGGYVLLHAGARLPYSRWPGFAALAHLLLERTDRAVVLLGHEGAPPAPRPRLHVIDGLLPFAAFDALLAGAAVFVGNDSGPKHLAALRGTPVVSLHMARLNWSEWGQEGEGLVISRRVPCAGCAIGAHPEECGKGFACLVNITPDEVLGAVERLLAS